MIREEVVAVLKRGEKTIGISSSTPNSSYHSNVTDNKLNLKVTGKSKQGEDGTEKIGNLLIKKKYGDCLVEWDVLIQGRDSKQEAGYDIKAARGGTNLKIQVTRVESAIWKILNNHGHVKKQVTLREAAEIVFQSYLNKEQKYPKALKKELILALDATETPGFAFDSITEIIKLKYLSQFKKSDFMEIWLVGPSISLIKQLK